RLPFRPVRINRLLGIELGPEEQRRYLERVGIQTEAASTGDIVPVALEPQPFLAEPVPAEALVAMIPTWRSDLRIEADLAEEIARVRGYETVPSITPHTIMPGYRPSPLEVRDAVRETLVGAGLTEVLTPALVSPRHIESFRLRANVPSVDEGPGLASRGGRADLPSRSDCSRICRTRSSGDRRRAASRAARRLGRPFGAGRRGRARDRRPVRWSACARSSKRTAALSSDRARPRRHRVRGPGRRGCGPGDPIVGR